MSLIKRPNSNNWYYLFQIHGRRYFGSTQTPRKTFAVKVEAKVREDAISRLVLGEVKPITLGKALERYKRSKEGTPNYKNIFSYGNKLLGFKLQPKTGQRIEVTPLAPAEAYFHDITNKHIKALVTARRREGKRLDDQARVTYVTRGDTPCPRRWVSRPTSMPTGLRRI